MCGQRAERQRDREQRAERQRAESRETESREQRGRETLIKLHDSYTPSYINRNIQNLTADNQTNSAAPNNYRSQVDQPLPPSPLLRHHLHSCQQQSDHYAVCTLVQHKCRQIQSDSVDGLSQELIGWLIYADGELTVPNLLCWLAVRVTQSLMIQDAAERHTLLTQGTAK